jgi:hypothetical protein
MVQSAPATPLDRHYLGLGSFALSLSTSHYNHNATTPSSIASTALTSTAGTLSEASSAMTLVQSASLLLLLFRMIRYGRRIRLAMGSIGTRGSGSMSSCLCRCRSSTLCMRTMLV